MTRRAIELTEGDLAVLAAALDTHVATLDAELRKRPWTINDLLRAPAVVDLALGERDGCLDCISPTLYFVIIAFQAADSLAETEVVAEWIAPNSRLPLLDVEPLREFSDNENRLAFMARLLADFVTPDPPPVPANGFDLIDLARWLDAVDTAETRTQLLRRLGDLALFRAGIFPDASGQAIATHELERLARSVGLDDAELWQVVDPASASAGLSALETLGAAWYLAAADLGASLGTATRGRLLIDIAHRMRAARRFLNHLADRYLNPRDLGWALAA